MVITILDNACILLGSCVIFFAFKRFSKPLQTFQKKKNFHNVKFLVTQAFEDTDTHISSALYKYDSGDTKAGKVMLQRTLTVCQYQTNTGRFDYQPTQSGEEVYKVLLLK